MPQPVEPTPRPSDPNAPIDIGAAFDANTPDVSPGIKFLLDQLKGDQAANLGLVNTNFDEAMKAAQSQAPPTPQDVPGKVNPFGGMAAMFAATLAEQMGARGATDRTQKQIDLKNLAHDTATSQNAYDLKIFNHQKAIQGMEMMLEVGKKREELAYKGTNDKQALLATEFNLKLADKIEKRKEIMADLQNSKEHQFRLSENAANKLVPTAAQKIASEDRQAGIDEKANAADQTAAQNFLTSLDNLAKLPGNAMKEGKPAIAGLFGPKGPGGWTDSGNRLRAERAYQMGKSATGPITKQLALEHYFDAVKVGDTIPNGADQQRLLVLIKNVFPKAEDGRAWMIDHGISTGTEAGPTASPSAPVVPTVFVPPTIPQQSGVGVVPKQQ